MTAPRKQLADMLRQSRLDAGYTSHGPLAKRLNVSRPVISKAENPVHPPPSDALLAAWADATGADLDTLTDLAQRAKSGTPEWFMPYLAAEAEAHTLRCWSPLLVPGPLQTAEYARAVLQAEPDSAGRVDELVRARLERQAVTGRAYVAAIIDQHVLRRLIGSPAIMAEQCAHLAAIAEQPRVTMHVIPEGTNMGLWGALYLATRDGTTTVCLTALEDITSTTADLTVKAIRAFEQLLGAALPLAESLDLILECAEQWKAR